MVYHVTVGNGQVQVRVVGRGIQDIPEVQLEVGIYQVSVIAYTGTQAGVVGHKPGIAGSHIPDLEPSLADIQKGKDGIAVSGIVSGHVEQAVGAANAEGTAALGQERAFLRIVGVVETAQGLVDRILCKGRKRQQHE